ncbi:uncharacterized protein LOC129216982 [Uloborus diversus]|uniref:uncharacterized protein LOC129216982 n=1 Tax=Uloborus diversus TaxID=327109 RepID=UPI0024091582|nr:uncharacterized protein LOC129216982 [Uloborus diversus]
MKLLLVLCLLGLAAADLLQDAAPAIDESVSAFMKGAVKAGSLSKALGVEDPTVDKIGEDIETELGKHLKEALKELLEKIRDHVENGEGAAKELIEKIKELREKIKEMGGENGEKMKEILQKIRAKVKEVLRKILERLGLGKRNLDDTMDQVARMKFREILDKIKEKILSQENIQKIREYIRNLAGESEIIKKIKEFFESLEDKDIREIIKHFLEYKPGHIQKRGEAWEKLKGFFKDLNIKLQEHTRNFGEWVKDMWGKGLDKLKEKYGTVKAIAMEFISHSKDMSAEMAREALEFLRPYKDDLGALWQQVIEAAKEAIGRF